MGSSRWDAGAWSSHATRTAHKTQDQIFTSKAASATMDPSKLKNSKGEVIGYRESTDSAANPNSTPVILAVDDTGSMGILATTIIKTGLGVIMTEIYNRKPIPDPHILCAAVGDAYSDRSPLQVTQFEADISIVKQVEDFFIESNGGGNGGESYISVWYFAAMKTKCDAQIKRGRKGYLFTIGDEPPHLELTKSQIKVLFGDDVERDFTAKQLLDIVSQHWEVFHLVVNPGSYPTDRWEKLLGERMIKVADHEKLAEVIVSTIQVIEGATADDVIASWNGDTSLVVADAIGGLAKTGGGSTGVVRL